MAKPSSNPGTSVPSPMALITFLVALAAVIGLGGLVAGVMRLLSASRSGQFGVSAVLESGAWIVSGLAVAAVLCAVGWFVGQLYDSARTGRQMLSAMQELETLYVARPGGALDQEQIRQILAQLCEINENLMLSPGQRQEKRRRR